MTNTGSLNNKIFDKSNVAVFCIFGMFLGFLFPTVLLSIFTFFFGINAIRDISPRRWFRDKWWLVGIAWIAIYALTWFWSDDKHTWENHLQVKLPLLILPLAFDFLPRFSVKQLRYITLIMALLLVGSAFYSFFFLLRMPAYYIRQYRFSNVLPSLPKRDHIRPSLAIALFIVWGVYVWPILKGWGLKWLIGVCMAILVIYLHIQAVKTGLVSLYVFVAAYSIYLLLFKKKLAGIIILASLPVFFFLADKFIPTFRERLNYINFSYYMFQHGDKSGNYGDNNRLMSYTLAMDIIRQHPLTGVGTGDMLQKMGQAYAAMYPEVPPGARLLPHNQFLVVGLGCGIPAMLIFIFWVFMPLAALQKNRQSFFFFIVWFILLLHLMIEPALEIQLGLFIYLFFLLLQKHELQDSGPALQKTLNQSP